MVVILLVGGSGQQFCLWGAPGSNPACGEPLWSQFCLLGAPGSNSACGELRAAILLLASLLSRNSACWGLRAAILLVGSSGQQSCLWRASLVVILLVGSSVRAPGAQTSPPLSVASSVLACTRSQKGPKVSALRRPRKKPTRGLLSNSDKSLQMCSLQWAATGGSQGGPRTPALYVLLGTRGAGGLLLQARAGRCGRPGTRTHTAAHSVQVAQKVLVEPTS